MILDTNARSLKYGDFAYKHLKVRTQSGDEVYALCPFHDERNPSFAFNLRTGLFFCHSGSCSARGGINWLRVRLGLDPRRKEEVTVSEIQARLRTLLRDNNDPGPMTLDDQLLNRYRFPTDYWSVQRGFEDKTAAIFDLGYDIMENAGTIPIRNMDGALVTVCKRYIDPTAPMKYHYPKGFNKSHHLFGSWLVANDDTFNDTLVLVEGPLDAIKLWQAGIPAVAVMGSYISPSQIRILRLLGVGQLVLFFDNDKAGRALTSQALGWKKTIRPRTGELVWRRNLETDLRRSFIVRKVNYLSAKKCDPGDLNSRVLRKMVRTAVIAR